MVKLSPLPARGKVVIKKKEESMPATLLFFSVPAKMNSCSERMCACK